MDTLMKSTADLIAQPTSLFALLAVLILILGYLQMRRIHFTTHMLINVALMLALTIVLHQLRIFHMPQGGSVTIGGMIPLLFLTYRYGAGIGCLAGFLYGMMNLMQDAFILHPLQVLFDYPLPYMALAIAAAVPGRIFAGAALAFAARLPLYLGRCVLRLIRTGGNVALSVFPRVQRDLPRPRGSDLLHPAARTPRAAPPRCDGSANAALWGEADAIMA